MANLGLEKIPDSLGHLILNEDGAVMASAGDLENEEKLADALMNLVRTGLRVVEQQDSSSNFKRLSVVWADFLYVLTISNHRVVVCKRRNNPQEAVTA